MANSINVRAVTIPSIKPITFGRNSTFDVLFVIFGGLPFYLPVLWLMGETKLAQNIPFDWVFWANQLVSMPHVWATYARLNRKIAEKKVHVLFGFPAYAMILGVLIYATCTGFALPVLTAVNVWQSYHYLRQIYGVSRFFGKPDGETTVESKLVFWAFHLAMPLFVIGRWNMLYIVWNAKASDAIIPVGFPPIIMTALWGLGWIALCLGIAAEFLKYRRSVTVYDCSGLCILLIYFLIHWYAFLSPQYYFVGFTAITIFHAVQYLGITWKFEERQTLSATLQTKMLKVVPVGVSFLAFCVALYFIGDFIETHVLTLGDRFWPQFGATCLYTISAHHYLADTVLWNRRAGL